MSKSILLLTRYAEAGASSRQRHYIYGRALNSAGYSLKCAPLLDDDYVNALYSGRRDGTLRILRAYARRLGWLVNARKYDLVWIEKEALPWLPAAIERALLCGIPYVIDFDDAWHLRYARHSHALMRHMLGRKLERLVAGATTIVAGNETLAEWARTSGAKRVEVLQTVVDADRYPVRPPPSLPPTITWIGTPVTQKFLSLVAEPLRIVQEKHRVRFRAIGANQNFSIPGVAVEHVPWHEETEASELAECHIGIMPLPDNEWSRGKCAYKLIQYMAAARPVVASPVGSNIEVVVGEETGLFAETAQDWVEALTSLIDDPQRAHNMGLSGRKRVEEFYSLQSAAPTQVRILDEALGLQHGSTRP